MKNHNLNKVFIAILGINLFQFGCSVSPSTNTNIAKNSNQQNANTVVNSATPIAETVVVPNNPAIVVTAVDIAKEFDKDSIAADKKYGKKRIEVSGTVETIDVSKESDTLSTVNLNGGNRHFVTCFVQHSDLARVEQLRKGAKVIFIGIESETLKNKQLGDVIGKQLGDRLGSWNVEITDCAFK